MTQPRTYLMTPPAGMGVDALGRIIQSNDLIRKIRKLNPHTYTWQASPNLKTWLNGSGRGTTCLWIKRPDGSNDKVTAFGVGPLPEYSQIGPEGKIVVKGWRAVFEACVRSRVATRDAIEKTFGVSLDYTDKTDSTCTQCVREKGAIVKTSGPGVSCFNHQAVFDSVDRVTQQRAETSYQRKVAGVTPWEAIPRKPRKDKKYVWHVSD